MSFGVRLSPVFPGTRRLRFSVKPVASSATTLSTGDGNRGQYPRFAETAEKIALENAPSRPPTAIRRLLGDVDSALSGPLKSMDARTHSRRAGILTRLISLT